MALFVLQQGGLQGIKNCKNYSSKQETSPQRSGLFHKHKENETEER
jgi:hypothetical protein